MIPVEYLISLVFITIFALFANCADSSAPKLLPVQNNRLVLKENANLQIHCSVQEGSQPYFFEWQRNGKSLKSGPDVSYKIETSDISSIMTIRKIQSSDAGNYTCTVKNAYGSDWQYSLLTIRGKFKFKLFFENAFNLIVGSIYGAIGSITESSVAFNFAAIVLKVVQCSQCFSSSVIS